MIEKLLTGVAGLALMIGCSEAAPGSRANAELKDKDGKTIGSAILREQAGGVLVLIRVDPKGLTPGLHAVHIHAVGKCDAPGFTGAAGHFNPAGKKHELKSAEGAHAGDMPNMLVMKDGSGRFEVLTDGITLRSDRCRCSTPMVARWSYTLELTMMSPIRRVMPAIAPPAV